MLVVLWFFGRNALKRSTQANIQVNHTPNADYDEEDEALLEAAIVTIPKHSSAVKVTKRSRQDMMLEEPVAVCFQCSLVFFAFMMSQRRSQFF